MGQEQQLEATVRVIPTAAYCDHACKSMTHELYHSMTLTHTCRDGRCTGMSNVQWCAHCAGLYHRLARPWDPFDGPVNQEFVLSESSAIIGVSLRTLEGFSLILI